MVGRARGPSPWASARALPTVTFVLLLACVGAWLPAANGQGPLEQRLEFVCAEDGPLIPGPGGDQIVVYGCPMKMSDVTYILGNVELVVDPGDTRHQVLVSLHGGPSPTGPSNRSRTGQTHSAFGSLDDGLSWSDNPSDSNYPEAGVYGESASATIDGQGRVTMVYSWARGSHEHFFRVYRPGAIDSRFGNSVFAEYAAGGYDVEPSVPGDFLLHPRLAYVPSTDPATQGNVVLTWFERTRNGALGVNGFRGWIDAMWQGEGQPSVHEGWSRLEPSQAIGPCVDASHPAVWQGRVYIACVEDGGAPNVDVWSIEPSTGAVRREGRTGLQGHQPRLAVNAHGYMAVVTSDLISTTEVRVQVAFGWEGRSWTRPHHDLGPWLHARLGARDLLSARVTALALSDDHPTLFLVYQERNNVGFIPSAPSDPSNPQARTRDYMKLIVSLDECTFPIATGELNLGVDMQPYQVEGYFENPSAFDDLQDGFQRVYREEAQEERIYFAVGDYGLVQLGAVRAPSGFSDATCALAPAVPPPEPQPNPNPDPNPGPDPNPNPQPNPNPNPQPNPNPEPQPNPGQAPAPVAEMAGAPAAQAGAAPGLGAQSGATMPGGLVSALVGASIAMPALGAAYYAYGRIQASPQANPFRSR